MNLRAREVKTREVKMDKKRTLQSNSIQKIIETCAKSSVLHLKMGDLEIDFAPKPPPAPVFITPPPLTEEEKQDLDAERDRERLDYLRITDPLEYEKLMEKHEKT